MATTTLNSSPHPPPPLSFSPPFHLTSSIRLLSPSCILGICVYCISPQIIKFGSKFQMTLSFVTFKDHNALMANLLSQDHHVETQ